MFQAWQARRHAREATAGAASLEVSLQRIADALERSSLGKQPRSKAAAVTAEPPTEALGSAAPLPEFNVEFVSGQTYRLRNVSTVRATGVSVTVDPEGLAEGLPVAAELPPLASTAPFLVAGSWQIPAPGEVLVACDQLPEPVRVPLPPRR